MGRLPPLRNFTISLSFGRELAYRNLDIQFRNKKYREIFSDVLFIDSAVDEEESGSLELENKRQRGFDFFTQFLYKLEVNKLYPDRIYSLSCHLEFLYPLYY